MGGEKGCGGEAVQWVQERERERERQSKKLRNKIQTSDIWQSPAQKEAQQRALVFQRDKFKNNHDLTVTTPQ